MVLDDDVLTLNRRKRLYLLRNHTRLKIMLDYAVLFVIYSSKLYSGIYLSLVDNILLTKNLSLIHNHLSLHHLLRLICLDILIK